MDISTMKVCLFCLDLFEPGPIEMLASTVKRPSAGILPRNIFVSIKVGREEEGGGAHIVFIQSTNEWLIK